MFGFCLFALFSFLWWPKCCPEVEKYWRKFLCFVQLWQSWLKNRGKEEQKWADALFTQGNTTLLRTVGPWWHFCTKSVSKEQHGFLNGQRPSQTREPFLNGLCPCIKNSKNKSESLSSFRTIRSTFKIQVTVFALSLWGRASTKCPSPEQKHHFFVIKVLRWYLCFCRCCNTCDDVREAYRRRGWAFKNPDTIEQCKREGFSQKMQEQKNEGCQVYGFLEVNKVRDEFCCIHAVWGWLWEGRIWVFLSFSSFRCSCAVIK